MIIIQKDSGGFTAFYWAYVRLAWIDGTFLVMEKKIDR